MYNFDDQEKRYNLQIKKNKELLNDFEIWMANKKITEKTMKKHVFNIKIYINEYLLYCDIEKPEEGFSLVGNFFGYWFIRKVIWANSNHLKSVAISIKRFYLYLFDRGYIKKEDLNDLNRIIKENLGKWVDSLHKFEDGFEK